MTNRDKPSALEKVAGSFGAGALSNAAAVFGSSVTPLAAFVPFLTQSLATQRHAERIEKALQDLNADLEAQSEKINDLTDSQFKIISESVSATLQTIDVDKLKFLRSIVRNTVDQDSRSPADADFLARTIRDISAEELKFLIDSYRYGFIFFGDPLEDMDALYIPHGSKQETLASGLINMGLLYSKVSTFGTVRFEFSPIVEQLLELVREKA